MGPIRLDENSTGNALNEVFSMQKGEVFSISPEFFEEFLQRIPKDKLFRFIPIIEGSSDFSKYGSNCYRVIQNEKILVL